MPLKGSRFQSREEIKKNATDHLKSFKKEGFQGSFQKWEERRNKCVKAQGVYFEGDHLLKQIDE